MKEIIDYPSYLSSVFSPLWPSARIRLDFNLKIKCDLVLSIEREKSYLKNAWFNKSFADGRLSVGSKHFVRKSFAVWDNSGGISGACLSLPSFNNNAPVFTTDSMEEKQVQQNNTIDGIFTFMKRHFTRSHFDYCTTDTPDINFRSITHRWYQNDIRTHILQST